jgi:hypothetical protein
MDLKESKFYHAGEAMNFAVFSDDPCRVKYIESIRLPIGQSQVEVYAIEPGANSQWIVVQQRNDGKSSFRLFVKEKETFPESQWDNLPKYLTGHILQRVLEFSTNNERRRAA